VTDIKEIPDPMSQNNAGKKKEKNWQWSSTVLI
jgi:hypothetical protein